MHNLTDALDRPDLEGLAFWYSTAKEESHDGGMFSGENIEFVKVAWGLPPEVVYWAAIRFASVAFQVRTRRPEGDSMNLIGGQLAELKVIDGIDYWAQARRAVSMSLVSRGFLYHLDPSFFEGPEDNFIKASRETAQALPPELVYWCYIRLVSYDQTGHDGKAPADLLVKDVLPQWREKRMLKGYSST